MAKVEQQIVVRIKTIIDGLEGVKAYSDVMKRLGKGRGADNLAGGFLKAGAAAGITAAAAQKLLQVTEALGRVGVQGLSAFVEEGIRFNATIESARIGIATLVANTYDIRDAKGELLAPVEAFNAALETSGDLERALQKSAIETKFEFQDLLTFFNSTVIASAGLKTNLTQLVQLTQDFSLAAGAANIDVEKVNTGIQQILTGNTTVRNQLARVVFPGLGTREINDQLKKYKEAGTLVDFLSKKLEIFRLSADTVAQSFEAVASNVADAFKVFAAEATLPLFDKLKETLGFIINQIVDLSGDAVKLSPTFQKLADTFGNIAGFLGDRLLEIVKSVFEYLGDWADYLSDNKDAVEDVIVSLYTIAEQVAGIAFDLFSVVGDVNDAAEGTGTWAERLQDVALWVGALRDILNIIIGSIEVVIGMLVQGVAAALSFVGQNINDIVINTGTWLGELGRILGRLFGIGDALVWIGQKMQIFGDGAINAGLDRFVSGWSGEGVGRANEGLLRGFKPTTRPSRKNSYSFTPRTSLNGKPGGGGDAARSERERVRDAQRLFNEIEKFQISSAERALAIATASNKALLDVEQRRYDKGLISAEEFYKRKAEIENTDLDNQKANLNKQSEYAELALKRNLGAIAGKFELTESEVDSIVDKIKNLAETEGGLAGADAVTIKQAIEYTKYLEQTADIKQKLNLIDLKRKDIQADTTEATEKQARANKVLFDSLSAEFGEASGQEGLTELFNLQKRVADEFPKILAETNRALPGVKEFAEQIHNAGEVDASSLPQMLEDAGIKFGDLSDEARLFIKLMERLQSLARTKTVDGAVEQARNTYQFAVSGAQASFARGDISLGAALRQVQDAKIIALDKLNTKLKEQTQLLNDREKKQIATDQDRQHVEVLRREVDDLNRSLRTELDLINSKEARDDAKFQSASQLVDARRQAGDISAKRAKTELLALQQAQIAKLEEELVTLAKADQHNLDVQQKIADTKAKLAELRNEMNADFINLAQNINGQIGDALSGFLDSIIDGTESIGEAFKKMLAGMLLGIAKAIAQALLLKFILTPLGLTGGSTAGAGGWLSGLVGGKKAEGGIIVGSGTGVSDTAGLFALSHGEGVIPARRVSQYGVGFINSIINGSFLPRMAFAGFASGGFPSGAPASGRGGGGVRIINTVDPNLISDFMSSSQGEEIIVNIIGKNPGLVQRLA